MPYKDSETAKSAARERQKKHRQGVTEGVTKQGVTGQGVTRIAFIGNDLGPDLVKDIELAATLMNDREARYERAYQYKHKEMPAILHALTEDRVKMEKVTQSLKDHNVSDLVRYGTRGPTFNVVSELLEVTG